MKINYNELKDALIKVITEQYAELYPDGLKEMDEIISEDTYTIDPENTNMQQKVQKIKNDTSLFDPNKDKINIAGAGDESITESTYKKSDVLSLIAEAKKKKGKTDDYLKAIKKADRDLGYELDGPGWNAKDKAHKNKKQYDRKDKKDSLNDSVNEEILSKNDVLNMILEKKYNGKAYTKSELLKEINGQ